jgi:hypothetical protein
MKEDAGFITGKRGTRLERTILRRAFAIGATVVMNDLTHTLRYGDITVFRPDLWPEGESPFLLIEAKTGRGGNKGRAARQKCGMKQIVEYLSSDTRTVEGHLWQRVSVRQFPEYHGDTFARLATALPRGGRLVEEVERGLYYILLDGACKTYNYDEVFGPLLDKFGPMLALRVNDMKRQHLGYYPFPLSIRDPDVLFRFYNDEFVTYVFVSMEHVNAALASDGTKIKLTDDAVYPWQILQIGEIGVGPYVSFYPLWRLASEFLRLDWLLNNLITGPVYDAWQQYLTGPAKGMRLTPQAPGSDPL